MKFLRVFQYVAVAYILTNTNAQTFDIDFRVIRYASVVCGSPHSLDMICVYMVSVLCAFAVRVSYVVLFDDLYIGLNTCKVLLIYCHDLLFRQTTQKQKKHPMSPAILNGWLKSQSDMNLSPKPREIIHQSLFWVCLVMLCI